MLIHDRELRAACDRVSYLFSTDRTNMVGRCHVLARSNPFLFFPPIVYTLDLFVSYDIVVLLSSKRDTFSLENRGDKFFCAFFSVRTEKLRFFCRFQNILTEKYENPQKNYMRDNTHTKKISTHRKMQLIMSVL